MPSAKRRWNDPNRQAASRWPDTSTEFARLEWERMWTRVWLLAGRESDLQSPGDYFTFEIGPESPETFRRSAHA